MNVNLLLLLLRTTTRTQTPIARARDAVTIEATTDEIIITVFRRDCAPAPGVILTLAVVAESGLDVVSISAIDEVGLKKVVVVSVKAGTVEVGF